jgi:hypothetical protein
MINIKILRLKGLRNFRLKILRIKSVKLGLVIKTKANFECQITLLCLRNNKIACILLFPPIERANMLIKLIEKSFQKKEIKLTLQNSITKNPIIAR